MADEKKKIKASVSDTGLRKKVHDAFIPSDVSNVGLYLLTDWVLPAVWNYIQGGINSLIPNPGGTARTNNTGNRSAAPVANINKNVGYHKVYDRVNGAKVGPDLGDYARMTIADRGDAEMVRMEMINIIGDETEGQGKVSIGWFLDRCGQEKIPAAAWDWGWRNIDTSRVERYGDGWRIVFPRAIDIRR